MSKENIRFIGIDRRKAKFAVGDKTVYLNEELTMLFMDQDTAALSELALAARAAVEVIESKAVPFVYVKRYV